MLRWDYPCKESFFRWDCPCKESLRWDCPCKESFFRLKGLSMQVVEVGLPLHGVVLEVDGTVNARSRS
jgi:hypothetical protein